MPFVQIDGLPRLLEPISAAARTEATRRYEELLDDLPRYIPQMISALPGSTFMPEQITAIPPALVPHVYGIGTQLKVVANIWLDQDLDGMPAYTANELEIIAAGMTNYLKLYKAVLPELRSIKVNVIPARGCHMKTTLDD